MIDKNITQIKKLEARIKEQDETIAKLEKRIEYVASHSQIDTDYIYVISEAVKQIRGIDSLRIEELFSLALKSHFNRCDHIEGKEVTGDTEPFYDNDPADITFYEEPEHRCEKDETYW